MRLLDQINSPADLKQIPREELPRLAQELREEILSVVSRTGGHLAPSLGVVELTLVLHTLFDAPRDRIVWDIGHQAYAHKILTGRRQEFPTLRQWGGLSGFLRRSESPYDVFGAGHAGTAISAALGMVEARDQRGEAYRVIAVVGDGALTAGMAFEGLNHAGHLKKDFIVILNDNEMSIAPNVGALSAYLSRILTGHLYNRIRKETEAILKQLPGVVGAPMLKAAKLLEESIKGLVGPGMLFEELGFNYVGPIDGHQFEPLFQTLENVKHLKGPILVHVITKKGKGYAPAEVNAYQFHGTPPFDVATGSVKKSTALSYTAAFAQGLIELAEEDPRIVAITAAMPDGTGLDRFAKVYPGRCYDVGIAEQHAVTFAAGLAAEGMRPVAAIYSTFLQRAYDQIIHDVCLQGLPVLFALDRGGLVGEDGPTHHGVFDFAYLRILPGMTVMAPKDENELRRMLKTALGQPGPAAVRYPRGAGVGVPLERPIEPLPVGKAEVLCEGADVAILAIGGTVYPALEAAQCLQTEGIRAMVVNARFVKPLDRALLQKIAREIGRMVTVEDHVLFGGFGSAVLECAAEDGWEGVPIKRLGLPDRLIDHGPQAVLKEMVGIDAKGIAEAVRALVKEKPSAFIRLRRSQFSAKS
jgi:1-deoxy-D-xylulose-5-phosphate synthase